MSSIWEATSLGPETAEIEKKPLAALGEQVREFVRGKTLENLIKERGINPIIDLSLDVCTVRDAEATMINNNLRALPVFTLASGRKEYVAIINNEDLLTYNLFSPLLTRFLTHKPTHAEAEVLAAEFTKDTDSYWNQSVSDILSLSPESANLWQYSTEDSMERIIEAFGKGVHRALVNIANREEPPQLISQTDAIRFIYQSADTAQSPVFDIKAELFMTKNPVTVSLAEISMEAFFSMHIKELPALGVLNETGALVGNLSSIDIRHVFTHGPGILMKSVADYIRLAYGCIPFPITCSPQASLKEVIHLMLEGGVHRVWVVDPDFNVKGVVTMSDVCNVFCPFSEIFARLFD
mmetsp:Transcript_21285/g.35203  ORF Transcript_21285/g.35203 Transcript_21285/m.35203 type:complete len:351 (+) Transcript_21285:284-1336(+)|eukprot:CAMPEP_0184649260 /NCGR_PEP_ID=MMETSP0308-20130426/6577_1 /TAXON_ID=38269 /ORGANISM="Gloeochaete witrockiana, Strain SAG 46.84" /LENGTH=350 /DNA_ID=CAMNT_0027081829 /DNA_START=260 /DNA_END=1312 /DNA_ORIENTATION=+